MRILMDYRPALRHRTGVGEYVHSLAAALAATALTPSDRLTLFSSSLRDRLPVPPVEGADHIDAQVPVRVLNFAWHRLGWPPVEWFSGPIDVAHSMHPLLMPARAAARFITIHDLYFLDRSGDTAAEIRRDYARLAPDHARRADRIVVNSEYTRRQVEERLGIPRGRIVVCPAGAPAWAPRVEPATPGPILFVGTVEPRKNVAGLVRAYERLAQRLPGVPPLVVAGRAPADVIGRLSPPGLDIRWLGYVPDAERRQLFHDASVLVLPSFDEGFGMPALEAMTVGLPVVAANRGALPEVVGNAGLLANPEDPDEIAAAIEQVLSDAALRRRLADDGLARSREFNWEWSARALYVAYVAALRERGAAA